MEDEDMALTRNEAEDRARAIWGDNVATVTGPSSVYPGGCWYVDTKDGTAHWIDGNGHACCHDECRAAEARIDPDALLTTDEHIEAVLRPGGVTVLPAANTLANELTAAKRALWIVELAVMSLGDLATAYAGTVEGFDGGELTPTQAQLDMIEAVAKYRFGERWVRP
jgi:hypothetical protein